MSHKWAELSNVSHLQLWDRCHGVASDTLTATGKDGTYFLLGCRNSYHGIHNKVERMTLFSQNYKAHVLSKPAMKRSKYHDTPYGSAASNIYHSLQLQAKVNNPSSHIFWESNVQTDSVLAITCWEIVGLCKHNRSETNIWVCD